MAKGAGTADYDNFVAGFSVVPASGPHSGAGKRQNQCSEAGVSGVNRGRLRLYPATLPPESGWVEPGKSGGVLTHCAPHYGDRSNRCDSNSRRRAGQSIENNT